MAKLVLISFGLLLIKSDSDFTTENNNILFAIVGDKNIVLNRQSAEYKVDYLVSPLDLFSNAIEADLNPNFKAETYLSGEEIKFFSSESEITFMKQQIDNSYQWTVPKSKKLSVLSKFEIERLKGDQKVINISKPLISSNQAFAVVFVVIINGMLDASGEILLLRCEKNKWTVVTSFTQWVS